MEEGKKTLPIRKSFLIEDILGFRQEIEAAKTTLASKTGNLAVSERNGSQRKRRSRFQRRRRTAFSRPQLTFLERKFQCQKYLTLSDRSQVADMLNLSEAQVKCW
jgi:hypothetical protein